ncbi:DeoR/GlpR family DNA-binding transcription regulator [Enterococcus sp. OL5]|uniref:DeoR/GlpR family DNA-binding transcription regulator n=1 Tax=Enterococcus sp. OL5 TaxID=2590214 RepID=UPI0011297F79|nr:DeoR/GlpR family DNA-binding transcription regulator [Enterococcus sp. OL5]TPR55100.1 DeoR/GlpR transcriptional regulator [Enterococcus sp. OL5]
MEDRRNRIMELIKKRKYISIDFLTSELHFSASTIRRDLSYLEDLNLIRRTSGGAILVKEDLIENPQLFKYETHKGEKRIIAELALDFVEDYATIFLDSSSTSQIFSEKLNKRKNLTIFSTNLTTAMKVEARKKNHAYCIGGLVNDGKVGGSLCEQMTSNIVVDCAFISCRGFDTKFGASDLLEEEAGIKKIIKKNAKKVILLVDSSKFNKSYSFKSLGIDDIDHLITDRKPPENFKVLDSYFETLYWND